ncbi:helix-turn-helix domain-containing protein [Streptomyces bluensis]|uniref:helix-turn-helix domain-containing protein n=1 Tax=Streptomyces bluensis TaxID=33897 RepID=UPI0036BE21BB
MGSIYGDWLKEQRETAGLTQQQLADMAIMTRSHIAHIEAGRRVPSKEDARRLDRALGTGNVLSSLDDPETPVVWALLDEAVLRRQIGGPDVMAEQLGHLVRLAEIGRIQLHVLPFALGVHPLLSNMLTLMWFEDQPPMAYGEGLRMGRIHDHPTVVRELQHRYDYALGNALPLTESLALLRATARDYERHG